MSTTFLDFLDTFFEIYCNLFEIIVKLRHLIIINKFGETLWTWQVE